MRKLGVSRNPVVPIKAENREPDPHLRKEAAAGK
jgi:hypothetical protein